MFEFNQPSTDSKTAVSPKQKKPGPRPNRCIWCNEVQCTHCQCPGYPKCDHRPGEPCMRQRYKRRLVCNSCEKNKLKDEPQKKSKSQSLSRGNSSILKRKIIKNPFQISKSVDSGILSHHNSNGHYSFETLLRVAAEMHQAESQNTLSSPTYEVSPSTIHGDDVGLCMDSMGTSSVSEVNNTGEEVTFNSTHTTPIPPTAYPYYPPPPPSIMQQQLTPQFNNYPTGDNSMYVFNPTQIQPYGMNQPVSEAINPPQHPPPSSCTIYPQQPYHEYSVFPFRGM